jgi:methionine biosynthesis protein MetW
MPVTKTLSDTWFDTPNIHLCTILDFVDLCRTMGVRIEQGFALDGTGRRHRFGALAPHANLFGEQAIFVLTRS